MSARVAVIVCYHSANVIVTASLLLRSSSWLSIVISTTAVVISIIVRIVSESGQEDRLGSTVDDHQNHHKHTQEYRTGLHCILGI